MAAKDLRIGGDFAHHGMVALHHALVIFLYRRGAFADLSVLPRNHRVRFQVSQQPVYLAMIEAVHQALPETRDPLLGLRAGRCANLRGRSQGGQKDPKDEE